MCKYTHVDTLAYICIRIIAPKYLHTVIVKLIASQCIEVDTY